MLIYTSGFILFYVWALWNNEMTPRETLVWATLWPMFSLLMVIMFTCYKIGYKLDAMYAAGKPFGYRKRSTGKGWAVTLCYIEIQFWKKD